MTSKTHFHIILFTKWCKKCHDDKKLVMTSKIRHHAKNTSFFITSKKLALTSKCSWCKKNTMMTKCSSLLQKVRHDIKKTSLCQEVCHDVKSLVITSKIRQMFLMKSKIRHDVKKFVMTSKSHDVMTKTRHDIKKSVMTSKTCHDVNKVCYTSKTRWDVKIFAPILHFYDVSSPIYQRLCVFHKFCDFNIRPIPVVVLYPDMSIDSFVTIRPHLTKLCCDIMLRTHIHTERQTDMQQRH